MICTPGRYLGGVRGTVYQLELADSVTNHLLLPSAKARRIYRPAGRPSTYLGGTLRHHRNLLGGGILDIAYLVVLDEGAWLPMPKSGGVRALNAQLRGTVRKGVRTYLGRTFPDHFRLESPLSLAPRQAQLWNPIWPMSKRSVAISKIG